MRFLPTKIHGAIDYVASLLFIASPWLIGFADESPAIATILPVAAGITAILYSLLTNYEWGAVKLLSMPAHLWLDAASGLFLAASPWLFNFADSVYIPHLLIGIFEIMAALITHTTPSQHKMASNRA